MEHLDVINEACLPRADTYHAIVGPRDRTKIEERKAMVMGRSLASKGIGLCTGGARGIDLDSTKGYINANGTRAVIWILAQHPKVSTWWYDATRKSYIIPMECAKYVSDHRDKITVLIAPYRGGTVASELINRTEWVIDIVKIVWIPKDESRSMLSKGTSHTARIAKKRNVDVKIF